MKITAKPFMVLPMIALIALLQLNCLAQSGKSTAILHIGSTEISINGETSTLDVAPVVMNDRTLVPLRAIVEGLGGVVAWEPETETAVFAYGENMIFLTVGSKTAFVNTTMHTLDVEPVVINDRTMLPLRFVAENLGFDVEWDEETQGITVFG